MKNVLKAFGFAALAAAIAFSMAACDSESDPAAGNTGFLRQAVYTGRHNTDDLKLTITEKTSGKAAAYAPKVDDPYTLAVGENISSGTVTLIEPTDTTIKFTLKASKDSSTFTVTITLSDSKIINISGTAAFDGEGGWNGPGNVNKGTGGGGGGGGKGSPSGGGSPSVGIVGKTSAGHNVIAMDAANSKLKGITGTSPKKTLVYESLGAKDAPAPGDIIFSGPSAAALRGFFYKVKTVATKDGKTTIVTEMAGIEEAVEKAEAKGSIALEFPEGGAGRSAVARLTAADSDKMTALKMPIEKEIGKVKLEGTLELGATFDWDIDIDKFTMQKFELSATPYFKANVDATISGELEKEKEIEIYKKPLPSIHFPVGPIDV